jgi:hypothetical protein
MDGGGGGGSDLGRGLLPGRRRSPCIPRRSDSIGCGWLQNLPCRLGEGLGLRSPVARGEKHEQRTGCGKQGTGNGKPARKEADNLAMPRDPLLLLGGERSEIEGGENLVYAESGGRHIFDTEEPHKVELRIFLRQGASLRSGRERAGCDAGKDVIRGEARGRSQLRAEDKDRLHDISPDALGTSAVQPFGQFFRLIVIHGG